MKYDLSDFELTHLDVEGIPFIVRKDTSDFQALREVVIKKAYEKKKFQIVAGETWIDLGVYTGAFT